MALSYLPAEDAVLIGKADSGAELTYKVVGIYVGGTGDLNVLTQSGRQVKFSAVPAGTTIPIKVRKVMSTGTTATLLVALLGP